MTMSDKKTIFVGVSGGVDSSVTAALLQDQGHDVVGVFIRTWQPDWIECTWRDERRDAMRVCAHLDIPFVELDLEREYKEGVADYMVSEYRAGRTPNPDVMCNREVKFGGFLRWALEHGADAVATGHYARRVKTNEQEEESHKTYNLARGVDEGKDQSYFLWTLTAEQLQYIEFPIGDMPKSNTRKLAVKYNLPTATKKDSQGICFIGEIDMKDFLHHYIEQKRGDVLDTNGNAIGHHDGALFFTLGERHGFTITEKGTDDAARYVVAKDVEANTISVSSDIEMYANKHSKVLTNVRINQCNWISNIPMKLQNYTAQIRYHGEHKLVTLSSINTKDSTAVVHFVQPDVTITPGQSIVIYEGDICMGGGIVA